MFSNCHKLLNTIKKQSQNGSNTERNLAKNVMASLAASLQNSSNTFRKTQNNYLKSKYLIMGKKKKILKFCLQSLKLFEFFSQPLT